MSDYDEGSDLTRCADCSKLCDEPRSVHICGGGNLPAGGMDEWEGWACRNCDRPMCEDCASARPRGWCAECIEIERQESEITDIVVEATIL